MKFISIDLELEQPNRQGITDSSADVPTIIQTGIVCFELGDEINVLESKTIHHRYKHELSTFIKNLTSIETADVNASEATTDDALLCIKEIREKYDASRQLIQWGGGDDEALIMESLCYNSFRDLGFSSNSINVKHLFQMYCLANGIKAQGGLSKSMRKLGLDFKSVRWYGSVKGKHWAEADALNTAIIFNELLKRMRSK